MKRERPASVTVVVAALFAVVSCALFASVAAYLHYTLRSQLLQSDAEELHGKLELIRGLIAENPSAASVPERASRLHDVLTGHERIRLVVRRPGGRIIIAHPGEGIAGAERIPAAASAAPTLLVDEGVLYQVLAAEVQVAPGESPLRVELAMNEGVQMALLRSFRGRLVIAVLVGSLLAALLGWGAARYGMAPVRRIANAAARISAERLSERIDTAAAPRELQELVAAFNGMLERLESSFRRLEQFSSDLAHELRTPVNNMMLQTEVGLGRPRSAEEYARLLESIREECERLSRTTSEMLFLAKADAHQLLLAARPVSLRAECEKAIAFFQPVLDENGVTAVVAGDAEVQGDQLLIRRAVANLLSNAVRYTPHGGQIRLTVSAVAQSEVRLEVANPGPGIAPEHLGRVFDRFFRADASRGRSQEGAGLGLAIVAAIMALHAGRATAHSAPGTDTRFTLHFPAPRGCLPREPRENPREDPRAEWRWDPRQTPSPGNDGRRVRHCRGRKCRNG